MSGASQRTIRRGASLRGVGIHTGQPSEVTCLPERPDTGIVFVRVDGAGQPVRASLAAVTDAERGVTLGSGASAVRTVEHLLAAAAGLGVTNLRVEVRGPELPAMDGSAAPYCALLQHAGFEEQRAPCEPLVLAQPVSAGDGAARVLAVPFPRLRITYVVPLAHAVLGVAQTVDALIDEETFVREIAPARTWGFAAEMEKLRRRGLAAGASLENALGIGPEGYLNPPRMSDEPARHKVLDLVGDLSLLGGPLSAHVVAVGAGHALHLALARRIRGNDAGRAARSGGGHDGTRP